MRKFFLTLLILFSICLSSNALSPQQTLSAMENNLFGYEYKGDSDIKRLDRLEEHIYGQKMTGTVQARLEKIQADTGFVAQEERKAPSFDNIKKPNKPKNMPELKEDSTVDYPIVDKMEMEIFNTTYKNENIYSRLNRLEERVFTKTSNADLNTRVDKLASVIKPKTVQNNPYQSNYSIQDLDDYYTSRGFDQINSQSLPIQMVAMEEAILKKSYQDDNNALRLARMEQKLFNKTFPTDSDTTRMQRIKVAYDAKQNSYKYENNRRMQNMATVSQFSGILLMILAMLL